MAARQKATLAVHSNGRSFRGKKFLSHGDDDDDCAHVWFKFHSTYFVICQKSNGNLKVQPERKKSNFPYLHFSCEAAHKTTSKSEWGIKTAENVTESHRPDDRSSLLSQQIQSAL